MATDMHNTHARVQVRANGLIVFIPKYGIEGTVHLNPKDKDPASASEGQPSHGAAASEAAGSFLLDEEKQTVASPDGSLAYTVFDKVSSAQAVHQWNTSGIGPISWSISCHIPNQRRAYPPSFPALAVHSSHWQGSCFVEAQTAESSISLHM